VNTVPGIFATRFAVAVSPVSPQSAMSPAPTRTGSALPVPGTGDREGATGGCEAATDGEDDGVDGDGEAGGELGVTVGDGTRDATADLDAPGRVGITPAIEADGGSDEGAERATSEANPKRSASVATNARTASGT
jgi:hypothetical protein